MSCRRRVARHVTAVVGHEIADHKAPCEPLDACQDGVWPMGPAQRPMGPFRWVGRLARGPVGPLGVWRPVGPIVGGVRSQWGPQHGRLRVAVCQGGGPLRFGRRRSLQLCPPRPAAER
jgi:hypothetical protein